MGKALCAGSRATPLRSPGLGPLPSRQGWGHRQGLQDIQLSPQIWGLVAPWPVASVTLKPTARESEVRVALGETLWACPQGAQRMPIHASEERRGRHLDRCQFKPILGSRGPLVRGPAQGAQTVAVPWAEKAGRFSQRFERLAIDVLLEGSGSGACEIFGLSWEAAAGIKPRAVKRGLARKLPTGMARVCVAEQGMGQGHAERTLVAQAAAGQPPGQDVGQGRERERLDAFWEGLLAEPWAGVEALAMALWKPDGQSPWAQVPGVAGKIVPDPCHLGKAMNAAGNAVRQSEPRRLQAQGDDLLQSPRPLWL